MTQISESNYFQFLQATLISITDGVLIIDAEENYVFANEGAKRASIRFSSGVPDRYRATDYDLRYMDARPIPHEERPIIRALHGETISDLLLLFHRPDGTISTISSTANPVRSEQGEIIGAVSISRDVTERRQRTEEIEKVLAVVEQARREAETTAVSARQTSDTLLTLINTFPAGVLVCDANGTLTLRNPAADALLGGAIPGTAYGPEIGLTLHRPDGSPFPPENLPLPRAIEHGEETKDVEILFRSPDGSEKTILASGKPIRNSEGTITGAVAVMQDISERKMAEDLLRDREERFRNIFAESPIGIELYDSNGILIEVNKACLDMFGVSDVEEVRGFRLFEDPNIPDQKKSKLRKGESARFEVQFDFEKVKANNLYKTTKSGTVILDWLITPLLTMSGITGFLIHVQDVTEQRKAEEELQTSEEKYRRLFTNMKEGVALHEVIYDEKGEPKNYKILDINPCFEQITGMAAEKVVGQYATTVYGTEEPPYLAEFAGVASTRESLSFETFFAPMAKWLNISLFSPRKGQFATVFTDITDRKQSEEELRESEERYRRLIELSPEAIVVHSEGLVLYANPAAARLLAAKSTEQIIGKPMLEFVHPDSHALVRGRIRNLSDLPTPAPIVEERLLRLNGIAFYAEVAATPITYNNRASILVFIRDITDRKQAEEERERRLNVEAARAEAEAAQQRVSNTLESITDAFVALDREWRYTYVNQRAAQLLGHDRDHLLGRNIWELYPAAVGNVFNRMVREAMESNTPREFEAYYATTDIWLEVHAYPSHEGLAIYFQDISERKRVEVALRESEERYRSLFENASFGIFHSTPEGRFIRANPALATILGYSSPEELMSSITDIATQLYLEPAIRSNVVTAALEKGEWIHQENRYRRKDGSIMTANLTLRRVLNPDGVFAYLEGFAEDITERKAAAEALRESEEQYRLLIENIPDVAWTADEFGRTIFISPNVATIYGYSQEEMYQGGERLWFGRIHPADVDRVTRAFEALLTEMKMFNVEYRIQRKDGQWIWIHDRAIATSEMNGLKYAQGLFSDITERKQSEVERERLLAEVQMRAAELDTTLASIPDGLVIYNIDRKIIRMNPAALSFLEYRPKDFDRPIEDRVNRLHLKTATGEDIDPEDLPPMRALRGETVIGTIVVLNKESGTLWTSTSAAPIRTSDGRILGAVMILTDITRIHDLQEELQSYVHGVSHDLRAPLSIIQGRAQLLQRVMDKAGLLSGRERESLNAILVSSHRMNAMIQDLVDSARLGSGQLHLEPKPIDLEVFLHDLLERNVTVVDVTRITSHLPADLPPVLADPNSLERVLVNLLSNALKYSPAETIVNLRAERSEHEILISVADQGSGISSEDLPHVFERFYRAKGARKTEGLGLGLYITKGLVEANGGHIWAESTPGKGSTFFFTLPIAD